MNEAGQEIASPVNGAGWERFQSMLNLDANDTRVFLFHGEDAAAGADISRQIPTPTTGHPRVSEAHPEDLG